MTEEPGLPGHPLADERFPAFVDWILGAIIATAGLLMLVGGSVLVALVEIDIIGDLEASSIVIEENDVTIHLFNADLTDAELTDLVNAVITWTGIGLVVTGLAMVAFALGFVILRHRAHRRATAETPLRSYGSYALLGAVTTAALSFLAISPVFGGAVAGYLERGESTRTLSVGALAGFLPLLPLIVITVFVFGGLIAELFVIDQGALGLVIGATVLLSLLATAIFGAGLGGIGGYVGGKFAENRAERERRESS